MIDSILHLLHPRLELREPWLLLVGLLGFAVIFVGRSNRSRLLFSSFALLPPGGQSLRQRLRWLPAALLFVAVVGLALAMAGPRLPDESTRIRREGIAIMMVVDTSSSMMALDLVQDDREDATRLDAVKRVFVDFVSGDKELKGRPDDAIGLISFAGYADTRSPLTLDKEMLIDVTEKLHIVESRAEDGTALGDALGLAIERLRRSDSVSKVAVLLTDGVQTAGELSPLGAADLAQELGIKVYTIGAGTNGYAEILAPDPFSGRKVRQRVRVEIDEAALRQVADRTGGAYFRAGDYEGLRDVYAQIDKLERTAFDDQRFGRYDEVFYFPLVGAMLAAVLSWLLAATWLRRLPE